MKLVVIHSNLVLSALIRIFLDGYSLKVEISTSLESSCSSELYMGDTIPNIIYIEAEEVKIIGWHEERMQNLPVLLLQENYSLYDVKVYAHRQV